MVADDSKAGHVTRRPERHVLFPLEPIVKGVATVESIDSRTPNSQRNASMALAGCSQSSCLDASSLTRSSKRLRSSTASFVRLTANGITESNLRLSLLSPLIGDAPAWHQRLLGQGKIRPCAALSQVTPGHGRQTLPDSFDAAPPGQPRLQRIPKASPHPSARFQSAHGQQE